jgi:hypothetical protein
VSMRIGISFAFSVLLGFVSLLAEVPLSVRDYLF